MDPLLGAVSRSTPNPEFLGTAQIEEAKVEDWRNLLRNPVPQWTNPMPHKFWQEHEDRGGKKRLPIRF